MSLFGTGNSAASSAASTTQGDLKNDVELTEPPQDSVSDLAFSSKADLLAVSSWDKKVRIYEISSTGQSQGKAMYEHEAPVLSVVWSKVRFGMDFIIAITANFSRMAQRLCLEEQTRPYECLILDQCNKHKWRPTTCLSNALGSLNILKLGKC